MFLNLLIYIGIASLWVCFTLLLGIFCISAKYSWTYLESTKGQRGIVECGLTPQLTALIVISITEALVWCFT